MPQRVPTHPTPGRPDHTPGPPGVRPPLSALLLCDADVAAAVRGVLESAPLVIRLSLVGTLSDAMIAAANHPPVLAIIDAVRCEALEREFLDHLLRSDAGIQVLLLHADTSDPWPPHPRLVHVMPQTLLPTVRHWLASRFAIGEAQA